MQTASGSGFDLLPDARGLTLAFTHVVEFGPAHIAFTFDLYIRNARTMGLEYAFHPLSIGNLAHGKGRIQPAILLGDNHAFKSLQAFALAFLYLDLYNHGITGGEIGDLFPELFAFELFDYVIHLTAPK
jgi:hypothetical protein